MVDQYKISNELLVEDIYVRIVRVGEERWLGLTLRKQALQSAVQRLEGYVQALEEEVKTKK